ncbi:LuxR C-terminal-related transcriptional regulator [Shinella zoogloeoides]|jgi:DNA-binding NarL/FixJ family response regulator|uniref:LuxR C-terminal-related transcriptional regulator n=1 Tax=Shinella zoogloeoides TaxID=352475 RepID=UPI001F5817D6|nr:response regulator transcription factor [Shinella zoogloeoides]
MSKVSIGFFDDHPILLEGLVNIFSRFNDFAIVERGASAADAVRAAMTRQLDVIVLDLAMPGDVFDAIATICLERPDTKTIAFTASVGVDSAVRALDAGASGYVIKGSTAEELYSAIHAVLRGETFITQSFATKVISALRDATLRRAAAQAIRLSIREEQIVRLLLRGKTNKEIATRLQISEKTVKHYMSILMQKLSARNRIEVVLAAQRLNPDFGISPEMRRN